MWFNLAECLEAYAELDVAALSPEARAQVELDLLQAQSREEFRDSSVNTTTFDSGPMAPASKWGLGPRRQVPGRERSGSYRVRPRPSFEPPPNLGS
jgi:hypothetical protein